MRLPRFARSFIILCFQFHYTSLPVLLYFALSFRNRGKINTYLTLELNHELTHEFFSALVFICHPELVSVSIVSYCGR